MRFNALDYLIIIIIAVSILIGYRKGLIRSLGGVVSTLVGLGTAYLLRNPAANYLQEHYGVVSDLTATLEKRLLNSTGVSESHNMIASLPMVSEGIAAIHRQITEFAYLLVAALCFLAIYMLSSQILKLIWIVLEKTFHHGILEKVNHWGGVLIVLTQDVVIMAVLAGILASPLELGAKIGIRSAFLAANYMEGSVLFPYLLKIFNIMYALIVTGV
jgi:hypothetical protein